MKRGTGDITQRTLLLVLIGLGLAACQSPDIEADPARQIPSSVLVQPVLGSKKFPVDPALVAREVAEGLRNAGVFSMVWSTVTAGPDDDEKIDRSPDYTCIVEVKGTGFRPDISEANHRAFLSTFLWFLAIFPAWWIDDRTYNGSDVEIHAQFFPGGLKSNKPILDAVIPTNQVELDLLRRGATWQFFLSIILPPFWMDDAEKAGQSLPGAAAAKARMGVAEQARNGWPRAALLAESGCFLALDPPASSHGRRQKSELAGWILAREPLWEVRVMDQGQREVLRIDRNGLQKLSVPLTGGGEGSQRVRKLIEERLGGGTPLLKAAYRIDLRDLRTGGSQRIHLTASLGPNVRPASFTVKVEG